jgi:hypothetical protein
MHDRPAARDIDEFGQVLPFRRRPKRRTIAVVPAARPQTPPETQSATQFATRFATHANAAGPDDDFARYEQEPEEPIDYRQRMLMNLIAAAIVILLISSGVWIADTISATVRDQDCALQGRTNCAPIEAPKAEARARR